MRQASLDDGVLFARVEHLDRQCRGVRLIFRGAVHHAALLVLITLRPVLLTLRVMAALTRSVRSTIAADAAGAKGKG